MLVSKVRSVAVEWWSRGQIEKQLRKLGFISWGRESPENVKLQLIGKCFY